MKPQSIHYATLTAVGIGAGCNDGALLGASVGAYAI
jgi:hypothetical protein